MMTKGSSNIFTYFKEINNIDAISLCLLKKIYGLQKSQGKRCISKEFLVNSSKEYSPEELDESLNVLKSLSYVDIYEKEIALTDEGCLLEEYNRKVKAASIITELVVGVIVVASLISRFM